jgi:peptide deformylase
MSTKVKVVRAHHRALLNPCDEVTQVGRQVQPLLPRMYQAMKKNNGIGLAANQLGESLAVFITDIPGDHIRVYVNPEIIWQSDEKVDSEEGCLSLPRKTIRAKRNRHVAVRAENMKGVEFVLDTRDSIYNDDVSLWLSVCIQHEMDHINGIDLREYT